MDNGNGASPETDQQNGQAELTVSDEVRLQQWATRHKISLDCLKSLEKEGFTSIEAMELIDDKDLRAAKVPRGQQKLILKAVGQFPSPSFSNTREEGQLRNLPTDGRGAPSFAEPQVNMEDTQASGIASRDRSRISARDNYVDEVLQSFTAGQNRLDSQNRLDNTHNHLLQNLLQQDGGLQSTASATADAPVLPNQGQGQGQASWQDPQIHLKSSTGKTAYYDIVDFVGIEAEVPEEVVMQTKDGPQLVLRTNARKPRLEAVSLSQWSIANVAILHKLMLEGASMTTVTDYLSHTTRIYQLVAKFSLQSVLLYDRAYRKSQAQHQFRWGTELAHLQLCFLQARPLQPRTNQNNSTARQQGQGYTAPNAGDRRPGPLTAQGKEICKKYNSQSGCHFSDCKYTHVCSVPKCEKLHTAVMHDSVTKNFS